MDLQHLTPDSAPIYEFVAHVTKPKRGNPGAIHVALFKGTWEHEGSYQGHVFSFMSYFRKNEHNHEKICDELSLKLFKKLDEVPDKQKSLRFAAGKMQDMKGRRAYSVMVDVDFNLVSEDQRLSVLTVLVDKMLSHDREYHKLLEQERLRLRKPYIAIGE